MPLWRPPVTGSGLLESKSEQWKKYSTEENSLIGPEEDFVDYSSNQGRKASLVTYRNDRTATSVVDPGVLQQGAAAHHML